MARHLKPLVAGNWKMNGLARSQSEFRKMVNAGASISGAKCELLICPPAQMLYLLNTVRGRSRRIGLGGQDCHAEVSGAHTGDISAEMLKDAGATYVIVGHSERRQDHAEGSTSVLQKVKAAERAGLRAIVCVGETEKERDAGKTLRVIGDQLKRSLPDGRTAASTVIAYEPVWAIGTGRTPTVSEVGAVHKFIRRKLAGRFGPEGEEMRLLYGGSVKPENADELLSIANVNGALIGGASLTAKDFLAIAAVYNS